MKTVSAIILLLVLFSSAKQAVSNDLYRQCEAAYLNERALATTRNYATMTPDEFKEMQDAMLVAYKDWAEKEMQRSPSPFKKLPKGIKPEFLAPMESLWRNNTDKEEVFGLAQMLEYWVYLKAKDSGESLEIAFEDVLAEKEAHYGLGELVVITEYLENEKFLALVHAKKPVKDTFYRGKRHTENGHRVRSILDALYLEMAFKDGELYAALLEYIGDVTLLSSFDWSDTGLDLSLTKHPADPAFMDLYGYLYDTPFHSRTHRIEPTDFSNPEFFGDLRQFLPGLVGWN